MQRAEAPLALPAAPALQGLQGLQGLQAFAAHGLQGLQGFLPLRRGCRDYKGAHGFLAAQGLQGLQGFFAAQGLYMDCTGSLAAQGLQGFAAAHCGDSMVQDNAVTLIATAPAPTAKPRTTGMAAVVDVSKIVFKPGDKSPSR